MEKAYKIFDGDGSGIVFVRSDSFKTSEVTVKNEESNYVMEKYIFRNVPNTLQSPYISWANLNCCGAWQNDEGYLLTAVQEGKKLCAGITIANDESVVKAYAESLSSEYPYFYPPTTYNGQYAFYHIDVTRQGSISDYIDMGAVREMYLALGIGHLDFSAIDSLVSQPMLNLLDGTVPFDYVNPISDEQYVVTGLLLGYPLESTAALLTEESK